MLLTVDMSTVVLLYGHAALSAVGGVRTVTA